MHGLDSIDALIGIDPTLAAGQLGLDAVETLAGLFCTIDPATANQLLDVFGGDLFGGDDPLQTFDYQEFIYGQEQDVIFQEYQERRDIVGDEQAAAELAARLEAAGMTADASRYTADQALAGTLATVEGRLAGAKYAADQGLLGTKYAADQGLLGTQYSAELGLEGTKFTAELGLEGTKYSADVTKLLGLLGEETDRAALQAETAANPRRIFEALHLQAGLEPSGLSQELQKTIDPVIPSSDLTSLYPGLHEGGTVVPAGIGYPEKPSLYRPPVSAADGITAPIGRDPRLTAGPATAGPVATDPTRIEPTLLPGPTFTPPITGPGAGGRDIARGAGGIPGGRGVGGGAGGLDPRFLALLQQRRQGPRRDIPGLDPRFLEQISGGRSDNIPQISGQALTGAGAASGKR